MTYEAALTLDDGTDINFTFTAKTSRFRYDSRGEWSRETEIDIGKMAVAVMREGKLARLPDWDRQDWLNEHPEIWEKLEEEAFKRLR